MPPRLITNNSLRSRLVSATTRLYNHPAVFSPRFLPSVVFNYLIPTVKGVLKFGFKFLCAQVFPRIFAAATAFVDPTSRFQQREVLVVIVPLVTPPPSSPPSILQPPDSDPGSPNPLLLQPPPIFDFLDSHRPTSVVPFAVPFGLGFVAGQ